MNAPRHPFEAKLVALRNFSGRADGTREQLALLIGDKAAAEFPARMRDGSPAFERASALVLEMYGREGETAYEMGSRVLAEHLPPQRKATARIEVPAVLASFITKCAAVEGKTVAEWIEGTLDRNFLEGFHGASDVPEDCSSVFSQMLAEDPDSLVALFYTRFWGPMENDLADAYECVAEAETEEASA